MKTLTITMKANDTAEVLLYDQIGEDPFFGGISAKTFRDQIKGVKAGTLNLRINSPGGSVFEASAMMAALDEFKGRVEVDVDGLAASAASVIAMAGDEIRMAQGAAIMIHNPYSFAVGDAEEMRSMAARLDKSKDQLIDAYARKTKVGRDQLAQWMDAETWFMGQEAVDAGLADSVTEGRAVAACLDFEELVAKFRYRKFPAEKIAAALKPAVKPDAEWLETRKRTADLDSLRSRFAKAS